MTLLPTTTFAFFPTHQSILVGRENRKICSEGKK